jgi:YidC/Oxa1 family membrane protein insertase
MRKRAHKAKSEGKHPEEGVIEEVEAPKVEGQRTQPKKKKKKK